MGHPGAPNHDHHRSVWFAHQNVNGFNFWSNQSKARIRQKLWLSYKDGLKEAAMATLLGWFDDEGREIMEQELVAVMKPGTAGETFLELNSTFRAKGAPVTLGKTNFGFLAVRVAKSISAHFGGGQLTNSHGMKGERNLFGQSAEWMDYSGPVSKAVGDKHIPAIEGITYFDHMDNPGFPAHWHVRSDGWMGASFNLLEPYIIEQDKSLTLRYLVHAHNAGVDADRADAILHGFGKEPGYTVKKSKAPHQQFEIQRNPG